MRRLLLTAVLVLSGVSWTMPPIVESGSWTAVRAAQRAVPACGERPVCVSLALEAREAGEYETFHDLAWRAMQTGPPEDPATMYLLARAQALSGRRRDALIMLDRIAGMGVATEAATDEDLRLVRELPGWRAVAARFARAEDAGAPRAAAAPPAAAAAVAAPRPAAAPALVAPPPPAETPAVPAGPTAVPDRGAAAVAAPVPVLPPVVDPVPTEEVARLTLAAFVPAGLAYDAVSKRMLFGDSTGRRIVVVGDGGGRADDLVRADGAGFADVTAVEIDPRRGVLWVASGRDGGEGALHQLQLVSGRSLARFEPVPADGASRFADLAVAADGTVLVLDAVAPRILRLRAGEKVLAPAAPLAIADPASLTVTPDSRAAYVAHAAGIVRVDLASGRAAAVTVEGGGDLSGFERIRWHDQALVGVRRAADAERSVVRLQLNRQGRVTEIRTLRQDVGEGPGSFATISGDDLYVLVAPGDATGAADGPAFVVERMSLP